MTLDEKLHSASEQARSLVEDLEAPPFAPPRPRWATTAIVVAVIFVVGILANRALVGGMGEGDIPPTDSAPGPTVTEAPFDGAVHPALIAPCTLLDAAADRLGLPDTSTNEVGRFVGNADLGWQECEMGGYATTHIHLGLVPSITSLDEARRMLESGRFAGSTAWTEVDAAGATRTSFWTAERDGEGFVAVSTGPLFFTVTYYRETAAAAMQVAEAAVAELAEMEPDPSAIDVCEVLGAALGGEQPPTLNSVGAPRRCSRPEPGQGYAVLHLHLVDFDITSHDGADLALEALALRADRLDWTETSESLWTAAADGYEAVAVWEAPFLFVVTHANAATAMEVAEAVADELEQIVTD